MVGSQPCDRKHRIALANFHEHLVQGRARLVQQDDVRNLPMFVTLSSGRCKKRLLTADVLTSSCFEALTNGSFKERASGDIQLFQGGSHAPELKESAMELWAQCYEQTYIDLTPTEYVDLLWFADCYQCKELVDELVQQPVVTAETLLDVMKALLCLPGVKHHGIFSACKRVFVRALTSSNLDYLLVSNLCTHHCECVDLIQQFFVDADPLEYEEFKQAIVLTLLQHSAWAYCEERQAVIKRLTMPFCMACEDNRFLQQLHKGKPDVCHACAYALLERTVEHRAAAKDPVCVEERILEVVDFCLTDELRSVHFNGFSQDWDERPQCPFHRQFRVLHQSGIICLSGLCQSIIKRGYSCSMFNARIWNTHLRESTVTWVDELKQIFEQFDDSTVHEHWDSHMHEANASENTVWWSSYDVINGRVKVTSGQRVLMVGGSDIQVVEVEEDGLAVLISLQGLQIVEAYGANAMVLAISCTIQGPASDNDNCLVAFCNCAAATLLSCQIKPEAHQTGVHICAGADVVCIGVTCMAGYKMLHATPHGL